jgi:hypothetical protein
MQDGVQEDAEQDPTNLNNRCIAESVDVITHSSVHNDDFTEEQQFEDERDTETHTDGEHENDVEFKKIIKLLQIKVMIEI